MRNSTLSQRIQTARKEKNFRQVDLAKLMGISTQLISAFESGRIVPARHYIEQISQYTGQPLHYFTGQKIAEVRSRITHLQEELNELAKVVENLMETDKS